MRFILKKRGQGFQCDAPEELVKELHQRGFKDHRERHDGELARLYAPGHGSEHVRIREDGYVSCPANAYAREQLERLMKAQDVRAIQHERQLALQDYWSWSREERERAPLWLRKALKLSTG